MKKVYTFFVLVCIHVLFTGCSIFFEHLFEENNITEIAFLDDGEVTLSAESMEAMLSASHFTNELKREFDITLKSGTHRYATQKKLTGFEIDGILQTLENYFNTPTENYTMHGEHKKNTILFTLNKKGNTL